MQKVSELPFLGVQHHNSVLFITGLCSKLFT